MLHWLRVRDLALIDDLALEFGSGLNVITGETGAGKTLLTRGLLLAAGQRAGSELVRSGADAAVIEAEFDCPAAVGPRLADLGLVLDHDGSGEVSIQVRRTVARTGRSQVVINDRIATLATLGEIGASLLRVYGQHEYLGLTEAESHLTMLDAAANLGPEASRLASRFGDVGDLIA